MAIFEWRKFNFFDLRKGVDREKVSEALQDARITATSTGNNLVIICDSEGSIHTFSRTWDKTSFKGHEGTILLCEISQQNNLLVTVGEDINGPSFKVWNLSKMSPTNGAQCLRTVRTMMAVPTALAVSESGQFMAIGYENGTIALYRGDISRDRSKTLQELMAGTAPISGIAFKYGSKVTQMFVCSNSGVYLYNLQSRAKEVRIVLETFKNSPVGCCALQTGQNEGHFMVGLTDAVYCYTSDGRGPCYALECKKTLLQWFRTNLLVVSQNARSASGYTLTVIDIQNKFIVFSSPIEEVAAILTEFGSCYILMENKEIYHLDEKDLQSKLNLLFKKNLFDIAVRIAKVSQYDAEGLAGIFKQYGDHLYGKGDYAGAVEQYSKTIGYLEPSYVIRCFLDARHINHLTEYLQTIHKQGQATADHTTLLLNCFTRLDRKDLLNEFLQNEERTNLFDIDVAIKVCRSSSFIEQALSLAKANQRHDACLSILTEDLKRYEEALAYIEAVPATVAKGNVRKYGEPLMENCPERTIRLIKKLCIECTTQSPVPVGSDPTNNGDLMLLDSEPNDEPESGEEVHPEDFIELFTDTNRLIDYLEYLIQYLPSCSQCVYNTLIEHYLYSWEKEQWVEAKLLDLLKNNADRYDRAHVMALCRVNNYWPGVMHLFEEDKLYHLIIRHYLKKKDYDKLFANCKRLGKNESSLWLLALNGLKNDSKAPPHLLTQILQVISQENLQSPLQVLKCLAVEQGPTLQSVRDFFVNVFRKEQETIYHDKKLATKYSEETDVLKKHIKHLREGNVEFQNTTCDACKQPLSMPTLFFLCKHSYHQDCIRGYSETERDCPVCNAKNVETMDVLREQRVCRDQHDIFLKRLNSSPDPFSVVAEYFGKGLFNKLPTFEENVPPGTSTQPMLKDVDRASIKVSGSPSRQEDARSAQIRVDAQESEMRLKVMEQERVRQRQQAALLVQQQLKVRDDRNSPKRSPYGSPMPPSILGNYQQILSDTVGQVRSKPTPVTSTSLVGSPLPATSMKPKNPFEDEGDRNEYDNSKNPFGVSEEIKTAASSNPFEQYDSSLDPFAE